MSHTQTPNLEVHNVPLICPLPFDPNRVLRPPKQRCAGDSGTQVFRPVLCIVLGKKIEGGRRACVH